MWPGKRKFDMLINAVISGGGGKWVGQRVTEKTTLLPGGIRLRHFVAIQGEGNIVKNEGKMIAKWNKLGRQLFGVNCRWGRHL